MFLKGLCGKGWVERYGALGRLFFYSRFFAVNRALGRLSAGLLRWIRFRYVAAALFLGEVLAAIAVILAAMGLFQLSAN